MLNLLVLLVGCSGGASSGGPSEVAPAAPTPLRIGWQTTWATQGQLVAVLQHTDILEAAGFAPEFVGFPYGGPLNEGALAGAVDVLFTADQPALTLASKAPSWGVVGRLMYNRVGMVAAADGPVSAPADLRGRTVAVPFGSAAQREAVAAVRAAGLDPARDVTFTNLGIEEILGVVRAGSPWSGFDAAAAWDPTFAELERGGARTVASGTVLAVVAMDDAYLRAHPDADARYMEAVATAWGVYRADPARADAWYLEGSKLPFARDVLTAAAAVEPNAAGAEPVRVHLEPSDVDGLRATESAMRALGLLKQPLDVATVLRPSATTPRAPRDASTVHVRP